MAQHNAQRLPFRLSTHRYGAPGLLALTTIHAMRGEARTTIAHTCGNTPIGTIVEEGCSQEMHRTFVLRHINILPLTRTLAMHQRHHERGGAHRARQEVRIGASLTGWRPVRPPGE